MLKLPLDTVQLDNSIQCRAVIDTGTVNDYAERMTAGDQFPPIEAFGTKAKWWIGDGWHRVMAAKQRDADTIVAKLSDGGRVDALKHALGANALHGQRRSNADKRRAVEIALREFPKLSSRAVAKLCGVDDSTVRAVKGPEQQVRDSRTSVTGQDGKQYPARRAAFVSGKDDPDSPDYVPRHMESLAVESARRVLGPPRDGMRFANMAVMDLEQIRDDDVERSAAYTFVKEWIDAREA